MPVELIAYNRFVLGQITEGLIYRVTGGLATDYEDTVREYCKKTNFLAMKEAMEAVNTAVNDVFPEISKAISTFDRGSDVARTLANESAWPVILNERCIRCGDQTLVCDDKDAAIAFWLLTHPVDDIVDSLLPDVNPELNTGDDVYQFIGTRISGSIIQTRAAKLKDAVVYLLQ